MDVLLRCLAPFLAGHRQRKARARLPGGPAYKAVPLAAGENVVLLRFGSATFSWCAMLLAMNALAWLGGLSWMMWTLVR
jgi:hypothetical protein